MANPKVHTFVTQDPSCIITGMNNKLRYYLVLVYDNIECQGLSTASESKIAFRKEL